MYAIRSYYVLVFTADRPAELIDQADGQTLRQNNIFGNYIKAAFELPVETAADNDLYFSDRHRITSYNVCYTKLLRSATLFG